MYDVAVIGGGPVGSRVAYRLAEMGHSAVVIDKKKSLGEPVCCTGIISQECVDRFAIDKKVIIRSANSASVFSPSGKLLSLKRSEPQACIVDRSAFNVSLASQAQDSGVEYVLNSPVKNIDVQDDGVRIEAGNRGGDINVLEARALVLAAGSASKLVEGLGFGRVGDFAMGVQATVDAPGLDEVEVYLGHKIAPAFFAWLVPISPRQALVGLLARYRAGFYLKRLLSSLAAEGKIVSPETELSFARVPLKPILRTYSNRIIVVGSAAGQVKPTTGGGIYYGLLCADIAADNLHKALKSDNLSAKRLSVYEMGWKKKLGRELKVGYWSRKFYELLSDRQIDRIFDIIKAKGIDEALLNSADLSFDWHGKVVLKLIGHRALARTLETIRLPFFSGRRE